MTKMELEGMRHGAFPMDKDEGIEACKAYRKALEDQGIKTYLEYMSNGIYVVRKVEG